MCPGPSGLVGSPELAFTGSLARAIMGLNSRGEQIQIWRRLIKDAWSVRRVEEAVRAASDTQSKKKKAPPPPSKNPQLTAMEDRLRTILGSRVNIRPAGEGGKIEIAYFSSEDLDRLLNILRPG